MEKLAAFVEKIKSHGIEATTTPTGALLRSNGRMVAMLLLDGKRLVVGPDHGTERFFNLDNPNQEQLAIEFILRLRQKAKP